MARDSDAASPGPCVISSSPSTPTYGAVALLPFAVAERREVLRFLHLDILGPLPLQWLIPLGGLRPVYVAAWYRARYRGPSGGGSTVVACLYGNTGLSGALERMLVGRAGVLEGGRVIVFGDGRLRRAVALVGLREIFCRPVCVGVVLDPARQGVGVVYVGRGLEPVGVVPVELGEVPVEIHVAHYRVALVTDPGEVESPVPAEVRLALVVETVERMAQVEVMAVLVDL